MVFDRAKNLIRNKEVAIRGTTWLKEVRDDDGNWKSFAGWIEQYDAPKKKKTKTESEWKKKHKEKAKSKVKAVALGKIQSGISAKLVMVILEVTSMLLNRLEGAVRDQQQPPTAVLAKALNCPSPSDVLAEVLNSSVAIVLGFRFDTKEQHQHKFAFIRRSASDQLVDILLPLLTFAIQQGADGVQVTADLLGTLRTTIQPHKQMVHAKLEAKIDEILFHAKVKSDEIVEQAKNHVEEKSQMAMDKVSSAKQGKDHAKEMVNQTIQTVPLPDGASEMVQHKVAHADETANAIVAKASGMAQDLTNKEQAQILVQTVKGVIDNKDDVFDTFGSLVKNLIVSKMEGLSEGVLQAMDELFRVLNGLLGQYYKMNPNIKIMDKDEEIKNKVHDTIEKLHHDMVDKVTSEIEKVMMVIGGMMEKTGDDNEEDDEDDDK